MTDLPWIEQNIVDELAGALHATSSYFQFKPEASERVTAAVVKRLGHHDATLVGGLWEAVQAVTATLDLPP